MRQLQRLSLIGMVVLASATVAHAVMPDEMLSDPALEARARGLSQGLRCLVCQNQSIDDSNSGLARDLRLLVRERLSAGDSDAAAMDFIVARYGNFVTLKPPVEAATLPLWIGPGAALLLGAGLFWAHARRRAAADDRPPPLSEDERRSLAALTGEGKP